MATRIYKQRFNLVDEGKRGTVTRDKSNVKISIITENESTQAFRSFLVERGLKEHLGAITIPRERGQKFKTISLFGVPVKCHFVMWTAKKDTKKGRAAFWIGQPNPKQYVDSDMKHSYIINGRIVNKRVPWYALIITNRSVRKGMNVKDQDFVEYLLVPFTDIVSFLKDSGQVYFVVKHPEREKYAFDKMIKPFKDFSKSYDKDEALSVM